MRKKLIVSGCSFVDHNFYSMSSPEMDCSFPKWATIIADRLDMDLINLAFSGAGNNHILSTLTDCIADTPKEEIGLVLASWSQVQREDYEVYDPYSDPRVAAGQGAWDKGRIDAGQTALLFDRIGDKRYRLEEEMRVAQQAEWWAHQQAQGQQIQQQIDPNVYSQQ